ncbi:hypothetical protein ACIBF5_30245 [Micromonospora sp. NPDC050417]|uniref:hypothetical protein n=1 Tax=Micromonospora sp. NPDC050417 TaxID=3364280 RepID=UPI003792183E
MSARFVWGTLPLGARRLGAGLAGTLTDAAWLAAVPLGWLAPWVVAPAGFAGGLLTTQTAPAWVLIPAVVAGAAGLGVWFSVGLVVGAAAHGVVPVVAIAVALVAFGVPSVARALAVGLPLGRSALLRQGVWVFIAGLFTLQWCWSAPALVRPVVVWLHQPPAEIFSNPWILVPIVVVATAGRLVAQQLVADLPALESLRQQHEQADPVVPLSARLPESARLAIRVVVTAVLLLGLAGGWVQAVLGTVVVAAVTWLAAAQDPAAQAVRRAVGVVPVLVRLALVLLAPVVLFVLLGNATTDAASTLPFAIVLALVATATVLLAPAPRPAPAPTSTPGRDPAPA